MNQPRIFGPYTLLRRLAVGGMAEIYVASTRGLGGFEKLAAIKLVHPHLAADPQFVRMLVEEAKILVLLTHANIAQVFDLGCIDNTYYIAMEFVDGLDVHGLQTSAQRESRPMPIAICAYVVAEMLNGLDYAHRKRDASGRPLNIVHRDISPQNVVVSQAGDVKLVDFGIAKSNRQSEGTEAGVIKGKYFYMSPEQAWGDPTDRRSDVFSTGILLFEMLTGHMLYTGKSVPELIAKVRRAEIPRLISLRGDIPESLENIVQRALQREPAARYQSAIDMGEALRDFLYDAHPSFNAGKLSEFVTEMVEANLAREAAGPHVDDTRRLRALTRDEFITNEDSVLFHMRDGGVLATRPNLQQGRARPRPERRRPANLPVASSTPAVSQPPAPSLTPPASSAAAAAALPAPATMSTLPRPRARISNWPLADASEDPTAFWSPGEGGAPSPFPQEDTEPTSRYEAMLVAPGPPPPRPHGRPPAPRRGPPPQSFEPPRTHAPIPSILPSLSPPPPRNPFDDAPLTGTGKVALVPPRGGEPLTVGPIPPSPLVPDFRASSSGVPWGPILLGLACALLGILGYNFIPRTVPAVHLEIVSAPSGAQVSVDGDVQGTRTPLRLSGLEQGRSYQIAVEMPGYQTWSTKHVPGTTSVQQIAVLKPIVRTLQVTSQPEGADVFLNDTLVGRTPLALPSVQVASPQRLRLELPGHASSQREVIIAAGDTEPRVHFALKQR
ncbi:MAG TPA: serine/threonine-protein kinase [Polyangiales bacterium]